MNEDLVRETRPHEHVVVLALHRPERKNALSTALREVLATRLDELGTDESVLAVVLTGAEGAFSAGFDLDEFAETGDPAHSDRLWRSADRLHAALLGHPLPLIAAVEGVAYGGGFDLAVLCDLRVAGQSARFAHPEVAFGDVMYAPLRELVGGAVARELVLTGRRVDAPEARALGLVTQVVATGDALDAAVALAAVVTRAPRSTLLRTVAKIRRRTSVVLGDHVGATLDL